MHVEIKACPICGEPNRPAFPHCTKCRAGKYCEKCKRKHTLLAEFCDECIAANGLPLGEGRLDTAGLVPGDDLVRLSGAMPVVKRKSKSISVALVAVCALFIIGALLAVNTTGKVPSTVGVKCLESNGQGLIQSTEKPVVRPGLQAVSRKGIEAKQSTEDPVQGPKLPYEDIGACPFEGCTYRCWTANKDTVVKTDKNAKSPALFTVKKGEQVVGVTGTVITTKAGRVRVLKNTYLAGVKANAGQIVYLLTYLGEGYYKAWYGGKILDGVDVKEYKLIERPKYTWWVQIEEKDGKSGWSIQPENFDHKDMLE